MNSPSSFSTPANFYYHHNYLKYWQYFLRESTTIKAAIKNVILNWSCCERATILYGDKSFYPAQRGRLSYYELRNEYRAREITIKMISIGDDRLVGWYGMMLSKVDIIGIDTYFSLSCYFLSNNPVIQAEYSVLHIKSYVKPRYDFLRGENSHLTCKRTEVLIQAICTLKMYLNMYN